ncbi:MAG: SnoaL-like polyketide cyclase [Gemmatimonadetes bacterium]|jgi:ketosteroid isomerase-like protein|nr:SnoaL-like polyketide cyclase [Gemmatimonadota bacterium]
MTSTSVSQTQATLDHHLQCFGTCNVEGILEDYTDDSVLLTPMGVFRGREALRAFFTMGFAEFGKPGTTFAMKSSIVEGDCAFIVWDAETVDNKYEDAQDTFIVREGVIAVQTYSGKVTPKQR